MQTPSAPTVRELDYESYQNRQYSEIEPRQLSARSQRLRPGQRARWDGQRWTPLPYRGFAMQAMLSQSAHRDALCLELQDVQHHLIAAAPRPGLFYPLPSASFHQTVANTFSAERLQRHLAAPGLLHEFPRRVAAAVKDWQPAPNSPPPAMQLIGLSFFSSAIGILGAFDRQQDFERILAFRDHFYAHPEMEPTGLQRTRPFIGHLTLGYFEDLPNEAERNALLNTMQTLNESLRRRPLHLTMPQARLHRYQDLSHFETLPHFASALL